MTSALVGLGLCHVVTASGLRPARMVGRAVLASGGVGTLGVAAFPQPARGNSVVHTLAAAAAFALLAIWPVLAWPRQPDLVMPGPGASLAATLTMIALVLWFVAEVHGNQRGLAERSAAGAQSLWPLYVVATARVRQRHVAPARLVPEEQQ
jgi:hypothetical protein